MASKQILTDLDFVNASRINNLLDAVSAQQPVTKAQLDAAVEGLAWKDNVRVATSSNINLASPGASLDGVSMAANDRFLAYAQTTGADNGIYVWNGAAVPATRAPDCSTAVELESAVTTVDEGSDAGASFRQTAVNFTLGSGTITWTSFGAAVPSASETVAGKIEIATQAETDTGTDDLRAVTPLKLATYANRKLKYTTLIGDGSSTSITVTHNLNTRDVSVTLRRNSGNYDEVEAEVRHNNVNSCDILFSAAPSSNQYQVIVLG